MWKKAGVTEEKMTQLVLSLDHETVQHLKAMPRQTPWLNLYLVQSNDLVELASIRQS
jgi:hypothetical protein